MEFKIRLGLGFMPGCITVRQLRSTLLREKVYNAVVVHNRGKLSRRGLFLLASRSAELMWAMNFHSLL